MLYRVSQNKVDGGYEFFFDTKNMIICSDIDQNAKSPSFCKIMENCFSTKMLQSNCEIVHFFKFNKWMNDVKFVFFLFWAVIASLDFGFKSESVSQGFWTLYGSQVLEICFILLVEFVFMDNARRSRNGAHWCPPV